MKKTIFEEMGGIYVRCGDYFIPNLTLPEEEEPRFVGVWGQRHLQYLKEYRRTVYLDLLMSGRLNSYLADIEEQAQERFERIAGSMAVEDEGTKIVVYDYDGNQLLKLGGEDISSPDKLGSITGMAETENGFVAADGNMREIQFWAKDGTHVGAISTEDIFGVSYPWLEDMQLLDDGSLLIMLTQERDDGSANELMFFRLTGF